MADLQCTFWPDIWFGVSLTACCRDHDLGGSHMELAICVVSTMAEASPVHGATGILLAAVMFVGVAGPLGWVYRNLRNRD